MDGEIQSDSSAGSETGSEAVGPGATDETLETLKSLTQKVDELNEKIGNAESSLEQLKDKFDNFTNVGEYENFEFSTPQLVRLEANQAISLEIPNGAFMVILGGYKGIGDRGIGYNILRGGEKIVGVEHGYSGDFIPLPEGSTRLDFSSGNGIITKGNFTYCFLIRK